MKVSIIGGAGRVGSSAAYAMQIGGLAREIALIDVAAEIAQGEALDLQNGSALIGCQSIYAGGYEAAEGSDVVLITAGARRKHNENRLQLINKNVALFREVLQQLHEVHLAESAFILTVSNPVDILTMIASRSGIVPPNRVIGLGTLIDTARFRSLLAQHFSVDPLSVNALILGEHGDSMVPVWSTANIGGAPLVSFPQYDKNKMEKIFAFVRANGAELIRLKGGAVFAVGVAIKKITEAIILDERTVLPISSLVSGPFGIHDICLSLPAVISREGVQLVEIAASDEEKQQIRNSASVLKDTLEQIG